MKFALKMLSTAAIAFFPLLADAGAISALAVASDGSVSTGGYQEGGAGSADCPQAILYAAAGRHPIAGIAAAFAGVSGAFSATLLPGQLDALLFGITEAAAEALVPSWNANIVGNWYFISGMTVVFLPVN